MGLKAVRNELRTNICTYIYEYSINFKKADFETKLVKMRTKAWTAFSLKNIREYMYINPTFPSF